MCVRNGASRKGKKKNKSNKIEQNKAKPPKFNNNKKIKFFLQSSCKEVSLCSKMRKKQNATSRFWVSIYTTAVVSAKLCERCGYFSESNLHQMSSRNEQFRGVIGTKLCEQRNDHSAVHLELGDTLCFVTQNFLLVWPSLIWQCNRQCFPGITPGRFF